MTMPENPLEPLPQIHVPGVSGDNAPGAQIVVHHVFILDASGSMRGLARQTISGFNEQVQNIRQLERDFPNQRNLVTLIVFNGRAEERFFDTGSESLREITDADYSPNGSTRLYATVGETLERLKNSLGERLATDRVIITIMTDGENTDHDDRWSQSTVREYIQQVQADHRWVVTFIGANINVEREAQLLGIPVSNTVAYTASAVGTEAVFRSASRARSAFTQRLASSGAGGQSVSADAFYSADLSRGLDLRDAGEEPSSPFNQVDAATAAAMAIARRMANTTPNLRNARGLRNAVTPPAAPVTP